MLIVLSNGLFLDFAGRLPSGSLQNSHVEREGLVGFPQTGQFITRQTDAGGAQNAAPELLTSAACSSVQIVGWQ